MQTTEPVYRVGQVWERDRQRREIVRIVTGYGTLTEHQDTTDLRGKGYDIVWRRKVGAAERSCWCATWEAWVAKASEVTNAD